MANQSVASMLALHNHQLVVAEGEPRSSDWEVIEGEDLYADVESLQSFSISSGDEDEDDGLEPESGGVAVNQGDIHGQADDFELAVRVLRPHLEVTLSEHRPCKLVNGFDFHHGAFYSGDCDADNVDSDVNDVVGEPTDRDFAPLVGPLGFHVRNLANPVVDLGLRLNHETCGEEEVDDDIIREPQARTCCKMAMFICPGEVGNEHCGIVDDSDIDVYGGDDDDGGYEIDVDDELVPWGVANRLERQRMKKLGKRTFARMNKSKKMAHFYTKPACLHGKHGLGLKAY